MEQAKRGDASFIGSEMRRHDADAAISFAGERMDGTRVPLAGGSTPGAGKRSKGRVGYRMTERGVSLGTSVQFHQDNRTWLDGRIRKLLRIGLLITQAASHNKSTTIRLGGVPHGVKLSVPARDPTSSDDRGR
jgi:hypothetical protein